MGRLKESVMITLIIKGNLKQASEASFAHNVVWETAPTKHPKFEEVVVKVDESYREKVVGWFCETRGEAPYAPGTLLWHS